MPQNPPWTLDVKLPLQTFRRRVFARIRARAHDKQHPINTLKKL
jgi:hypothetical protein